jgi:hypothetical protein
MHLDKKALRSSARQSLFHFVHVRDVSQNSKRRRNSSRGFRHESEVELQIFGGFKKLRKLLLQSRREVRKIAFEAPPESLQKNF